MGGEGSMARRRLAEAAGHSGGVAATARWQGRAEQLERPSSPHGEICGAARPYNRHPPGNRTEARGSRRGSYESFEAG